MYFDNKTLDDWIALKFNPDDSTALSYLPTREYQFSNVGHPPLLISRNYGGRRTSGMQQKGTRHTMMSPSKQASNKVASVPAHDFEELRTNIATYCSLLFTLFGGGCDLYQSMLDISKILSHPFCMQNRADYTPEVCRRITWAIIVDTRTFFDDIKLADDFIQQGRYLKFPVSTLDAEYAAIKHGIKIERHNFPKEWMTKEPRQQGG